MVLGGVLEEACKVARVAPEEVVGFALEPADVLTVGADLPGDLLQRLGLTPVEPITQDQDEPEPLVLHAEEGRVDL